jgi:hypothetical protein
MRRERWLIVLGALVLSCGQGPLAPPGADERGSWPGGWVGDSCDDETPCADSLLCDSTNKCDWTSCLDAQDKDAWCARPEERGPGAVCLMGSCERLSLGAGQRCDDSAQCAYASSCRAGVCAQDCTADSMCGEGGRCVEGGCVQQMRCEQAEDPAAACALQLGVASALCEAGRCVSMVGELGSRCMGDGECGAGLLCEDARCVRSCTPVSCPGGFTCGARLSGDTGRVCRRSKPPTGCAADADPDGFCALSSPQLMHPRCELSTGECVESLIRPGCAAEPDPSAACAQQLGVPKERARCDESSGMCSELKSTFGLITFTDITLELASCDEVLEIGGESIRAPGAELTRVSVLRGGEELPGTLTREYRDTGLSSKPSDRESLDPLLSPMVSYGMELCPQSLVTQEVTSAFTSLGCQGLLVLSIRDAQGAIVGLEQGDEVIVGEFGPACLGGDPEQELDRYKVQLCETIGEVLNNKQGCADLAQGLARGSGSYEVPALRR